MGLTGWILIVGKLISTFVTLQKAFTAIRAAWAAFSVATGAALGPVLLIIAGIVAFIAIIKHLWDTNEEFRNNITATWNKLVSTIKPLIEQIGASLKSLWDNVLQPLLDFLMDVLAPIFEGVFNQIANIIQTVVQVISGILDIPWYIVTGKQIGRAHV